MYKSANHTTYSCKYHVVFCPKFRRPVLTDGVDVRLKEILNELAIKNEVNIIEMEVMPDHVHLLIEVFPGIAPLEIIKHFKRKSSGILKKEFPSLRTRIPNLWTRSCFIATVGSVSLEVVKNYIENQKRS